MNFGVSAFAWTATFGNSHLDLVPQVKELGFDGFEIPMFYPNDLPLSGLRDAFSSCGLEPTVCAILPKGVNPISPDPAVRRRAERHLSECVEAAAEIGAHLLGGPLFAPIGYLPQHRRTKAEWEWAVECFQSVNEVLTKNSVILAIEPVNRSETFFLRTGKEAADFCAAVGGTQIGVTIDTFHANIEEKNILEAIELLGDSLKHVHLSENDRGLLGSGHINFEGVVRTLDDMGYHGYLMVEGFGYSVNEPLAPGALWADQTLSPIEIASQGLAFLEQLMRTVRDSANNLPSRRRS